MLTEQDFSEATILVVDDDEQLLRLIQRVLSRDGFTQVHTISVPEQAVEMYREVRPDLLILDLNMPRVSGFDILDSLNREEQGFSYVPVLVLTGDTSRETRLQALEAGAKDFLTKPFDLEMLRRVRNMVEVRLLHRRVLKQNEDLERTVDRRTRELEESRLETVQRLSIAAEYRDDDTGTHIARMSRYSALLGAACGMPQDETELLLHAAAMHDIGKIGIPDSILLKKGKLDQDEWETMKTHTLIGARILAGGASRMIQMAEVVARTHHERWDGRGYPFGLAGEDIPLVGRIVAVCDVFDALTSERPYKKAWPVEEAVEEIKRSSGTQFDSHVVDNFLKLLPDLLRIKRDYSADEPTEQIAANVLVVDSDLATRDLVSRVLQQLGCTVYGAPDQEIALEMARQAASLEAVVLEAGLGELAGEVAKFHPRCRQVLVASYSAPFQVDHRKNTVLLKPFTLTDLRSTMRRVLRDNKEEMV